eukprot:1177533-Prorocentrum_minimum.AAC.5
MGIFSLPFCDWRLLLRTPGRPTGSNLGSDSTLWGGRATRKWCQRCSTEVPTLTSLTTTSAPRSWPRRCRCLPRIEQSVASSRLFLFNACF